MSQSGMGLYLINHQTRIPDPQVINSAKNNKDEKKSLNDRSVVNQHNDLCTKKY